MPDNQTRPFAAFLQEQRGGEAHAEASALLQDLILAATATGKTGSLTVQIKVKPSKAGGRTVTITDVVKATIPEHDREISVFYVDDDGNLHRNDPRQQTLPLAAVDAKEAVTS